uniref:Uncharacterized protein n=1 Tax=Vitis vinifera TaxID=29760 RepID=F6I1F3_VITVI
MVCTTGRGVKINYTEDTEASTSDNVKSPNSSSLFCFLK